MATRIRQAVGYVKKHDQKAYRVRLSRCYLESIAHYWRNQNNFHYMKIYDIVNYKKGGDHQLSSTQNGYITHNGMKYTSAGINESQKSIDYKARHNL